MELSKDAKALEVHNHAKIYHEIAEQYEYKFYMELKKIRDELLFMSLGCDTFGDYCKNFFELEITYVNRKIQIAVKFGEKHFNEKYEKLGLVKSLIISRTPDPIAYLEDEKILNLTVIQLKEKIKNDVEAEIKEEERKQKLEKFKIKVEEQDERIYEKAKKICSLCYHHVPLNDTSKNNKRFIKIGHLLYEKYVLPTDEATKEQRKKALVRIAEWHNLRLILADWKKHKKLYATNKDYKEFIDVCILKK